MTHGLDELDELTAAVLEGTVTDDQRRRLAHLLCDESARVRYIEMMTMHSLLRHTLEGTAGEKAGALDVLAHIAQFERGVGLAMPRKPGQGGGEHPEPDQSGRPGAGRGLGPLAACLLLGAGLILLFAMMLTSRAPAAKEPVASLTHSHHATWKDTQGRLIVLREGQPLPPQRLHLDEGLATLTFRSGAVVVLDARWKPVKLDLHSPLRAHLHLGRVTANVESEDAKGFSIGVPGEMQVVDLGTEFGLEVLDDGMSQVHVLHGAVEMRPSANAVDQQIRQVAQGQAIQYGPNKPVSEIQPDAEGFLTSQRLFEMVRSQPEASGTSPQSTSVKDHLSSKPLRPDGVAASDGTDDLVVRYRFERIDDSPATLFDSGQGGHHGVIRGPVWVQGRKTGSSALRFAGGEDCVKIDIPGRFHSLTLMAWVRPRSFDNRLAALLNAEAWELTDIHWHIVRTGLIELSVNTGTHALNDYYSSKVPPLGETDVWTHVAAVYDLSAGRVNFYANGAPARSLRIRSMSDLRIGKALIGNWVSAEEPIGSRAFSGDIDDLAIFGRALTAREVRLLYDESK